MNKHLQTFRDLDGNVQFSHERYLHEDNPWKEYIDSGMPHYEPCDTQSYASIEIEFEDDAAYLDFQNKIGQKLSSGTKSIWHPKYEMGKYAGVRYIDTTNSDESVMPKYPLYIPSKGRWDVRLTSDSLIRMGIKHYIIVEESQYEEYKKHVDEKWVTLLILPQKFLDEYPTLDEHGSTKSKGPGAARNFAWHHSKTNGFKRHWVMDDNIQYFYRYDADRRVNCHSPALFRVMEDFCDQYDNIAMAGPNYRFFVVPGKSIPPVVFNTRIYSCNLILNDLPNRPNGEPFMWRGRYNEDTIISLDMLESGYVTAQFNTFLQGKTGTQVVKGGNTAEFYAKEGTKPKSQMLVDAYPDVSELVWKFGRWHHYVDYSKYRGNRLNRIAVPKPNSEYGMILVDYGKDYKNEYDKEYVSYELRR